MRIDVLIHTRGLAESRTEAKSLIAEGLVFIGDKQITKPSLDVSLDTEIRIDRTEERFASRGGLKLKGALSNFGVDPTGKVCLDVGASSGGFTDCLIKRGASCVIAVDAGSGQMIERLRNDKRVVVIENFNARYMKPSDLQFTPTLAVMDVSFISATLIAPALSECLPPEAELILLIKPQFEVGREYISKGGIVKNDKAIARAVDKVTAGFADAGFLLLGIMDSPILGGDGNRELLAYFKKQS